MQAAPCAARTAAPSCCGICCAATRSTTPAWPFSAVRPFPHPRRARDSATPATGISGCSSRCRAMSPPFSNPSTPSGGTPPPRRRRASGRPALRGDAAHPSGRLRADAGRRTGALGARRQTALPAAPGLPAVRMERRLPAVVEQLVRSLPVQPPAKVVVPDLRDAARSYVFLM